MSSTKLPTLTQANALTESRYDFNRLEKNALYCIIRQVHRDYVGIPREQKEYTNMHVILPESVLAEIADSKHIKEAREALINLRHRDITIVEPDYWLNIGFINWAEHDAKNKIFKVEVSSKIMPYLVDLATHYTVYSLTVVISLKSKWSQRFYELCCQYKNHLENGIPVFHKNLSQLRFMFMLEDKYPLLADFKRYVLDKAQKELKEAFDARQCDLWFEYIQRGRGEEADFDFIIHTAQATLAQIQDAEEKADHAKIIYKMLLSIFKRDSKFCDKCYRHLAFHPEIVEPLYKKLQRCQAKYQGADLAKIVRFLLDEDFDMTNKKLS